jgi:small conductance mechanosensitive channel
MQSPLPSISPTPRLQLPQLNNTDVATAGIDLDGRELFRIAVPTNGAADKPNQTSAIQLRAQGIEATLNRLANQPSSDPPKVTSAIDSSSNLPVISVSDQYLMTVTTLDAQLQGQEPALYAKELTRIISDALVEARRERQPDFIAQQAGKAIGIIIGLLVLGWLVARLQNLVRKQQKRIQSHLSDLNELMLNSPDAKNQTQLAVKQRLANRERKTMKDVQRRFLQLLQVGVWAVGGYMILGLFAETRSLQSVVLSTPLKVFGVIVLTYLAIRFSDIVIDRIFSAFSTSSRSDSNASQRIVLRVSTFSRVAKGLVSILWISIGLITILSIVGIQILPLLAGAGIIGIAISLASQSLIKDVINGFLILLEDQYAVGDVIQVAAVSGLVESISLRITQIRNSEGRLITIPNSAISIVENLSKDWSRVDLSIVIAYDTNVDRAIDLIAKVGDTMSHDPDWETQILERPEVLGVENLSNEGLMLRIWIKTQPLKQWLVGREFRKRLKRTLDAEGISIGIPQQSFSVRGAIDEEVVDPANDQGEKDQSTETHHLAKTKQQ